jgi:AsmA protein
LGDVTVDKADIALRLDNGRLQVEVPEMTLYRGTGMARISLDTGDGSPNLATRLELRGVTVAPLFHDLADIDQLSGVGDISLDVKASGATPRELVSSLAGSASIALTDGALGATGLSELMKSIAGPFAAKTSLSKAIEFQSLAATGAIADGVLRNNDLKLNSPKVSATGAGTADLSRRQLDYAADVNSPELAAKIAITGGWDDPTYKALSVTITGGKGGRLRNLLKQIR